MKSKTVFPALALSAAMLVGGVAGGQAMAAQGYVITEATVVGNSINLGTSSQAALVTLNLPQVVNEDYGNPPAATWPEIWQALTWQGPNSWQAPVAEEFSGDGDQPVTGIAQPLIDQWKAQAAAAGIATSTVDQFVADVPAGEKIAQQRYGTYSGTITTPPPAIQPTPPPAVEPAAASSMPPVHTQPAAGIPSTPVYSRIATASKGTVTVPDTPAPTVVPVTTAPTVSPVKTETPRSIVDTMPHGGKVPAAVAAKVVARAKVLRTAENAAKHPVPVSRKIEWALGILAALVALIRWIPKLLALAERARRQRADARVLAQR